MPNRHLTLDEVLQQLHALADPAVAVSQSHFGIQGAQTLGIRMPVLRQVAKGCHDHDLALQLWATGIHEARIIAGLIDDPRLVSRAQMEAWTLDFDSWDVCDQVCMNLYDRTPFANECALEWCRRPEEFVRRAGFALIASMAVHHKKTPDDAFLEYLPLMVEAATDGRNFVRKAVNWALRQVGKRSPALRLAAMETANRIAALDTPSARWIASDALRELRAR